MLVTQLFINRLVEPKVLVLSKFKLVCLHPFAVCWLGEVGI
jgi:hypothetical protein